MAADTACCTGRSAGVHAGTIRQVRLEECEGAMRPTVQPLTAIDGQTG